MAYDYQGAISAGANPSDVLKYLGDQTGYDYQGAITAGANQNDVMSYMSTLGASNTRATTDIAAGGSTPSPVTAPAPDDGATHFSDVIPHIDPSTLKLNNLGDMAKAVAAPILNVPHELGGIAERAVDLPGSVAQTVTNPNTYEHPIATAEGAAEGGYDAALKPLVDGLGTLGNTFLGGIAAIIKGITGKNIQSPQSSAAISNVIPNAEEGAQKVLGGIVENPIESGVGIAGGADEALGADAVSATAKPVIDATKTAVTKTLDAGTAVAEPIVKPAFEAIATPVNNLLDRISPPATAEEAAGQIAQGKIEDAPAVQKAIGIIPDAALSKVNTYSDLSNAINDQIKPLVQEVDTALDTDPTKRPISEYTTTVGEGANATKINYVQEAINNLKELYTTTSDVDGLSYIKDLQTKTEGLAGTDGKIIKNASGLSYKDVNDLSRKYNVEFGSKAFSKTTGDALTSVNAQKFENIRKGLKETARQGLQGDVAKAADAKLSTLYDAKKTIDKMKQKVNTARQKAVKPTAVQKIAGGVVKAADIVTGGLGKAILKEGAKQIGLESRSDVLSPTEIEANLPKNIEAIRMSAANAPVRIVEDATQLQIARLKGQTLTPKQKIAALQNVKDTVVNYLVDHKLGIDKIKAVTSVDISKGMSLQQLQKVLTEAVKPKKK